MHLEFLTRDAFIQLAKERGDYCLSFYLPVHRTGREVQQDTLRLRNMLKDAEEKLLSRGLRRPAVEKLLEKPRALLEHEPFWSYQQDGLAIFLTPKTFVVFTLPVSFEEDLTVAGHFHVSPLLPLLHSSKEFYVLAVSENMVRMLHGSETLLHEIFMDIFPGPREALGEEHREKTMQRHAVSIPGGGRYGVFHGQGGFKDAQIDEILEYLQAISERFMPLIQGKNAPLVFAGTDKLFGHFRKVNRYPHLLKEHVEGSPDKLTEKELHAKAWPLVEKVVEESLRDIVQQYVKLGGTDRASEDICEILPKATSGKVERLLLKKGSRQPGRFDVKRALYEVHDSAEEGDEDLFDLAAIHTLIHGGDVYALEPAMLKDVRVAAIVRL